MTVSWAILQEYVFVFQGRNGEVAVNYMLLNCYIVYRNIMHMHIVQKHGITTYFSIKFDKFWWCIGGLSWTPDSFLPDWTYRFQQDNLGFMQSKWLTQWISLVRNIYLYMRIIARAYCSIDACSILFLPCSESVINPCGWIIF